MSVSSPDTMFGVDVAIDGTGDLLVTPSGELGLVGDVANCAQAIVLRTRTATGDLPLHPEYGSGVPGLVGSKMGGPALGMAISAELQTLAREDTRFLSAQVSSVSAPLNQPADASMVQITAVLADGTSLTLANATDPASLDPTAGTAIDAAVDPTVTYQGVDQEFFTQSGELDTLANLDVTQFLASNTATPGT